MTRGIFFRLFIGAFLLCSVQSYTQDNSSIPQPLSQVLDTLQEQYNLQFNYASRLVDGILLSPPESNLELPELLNYLEAKSNLEFVAISEELITIREKELRLCGYLKDKDTGEAIPFVTLQKGTEGVISDESGYFEFTGLARGDVLQIQHLGYKSLKRELQFFNLKDCGIIYLLPQLENLPEVTVYDYLIRGIDKLDDGSVVLNFKRFGLLPGLVEEDVLFAVQALPGIQSVDETVSNISIRGGSHDQNLITWDGIKMYQSGHFFGLISMYNPQITQKVNLRKNGSRADQADGVSGTLAMQTDDFVNQNLKASLGINLIDANASIDVPLGTKASLQVATRKSLSNLIQTPTYSNYFDRIAQETEIERNDVPSTRTDLDFDFYDAAARLLFYPSDKDRFRLNFINTSNAVAFDEIGEVNGTTQTRRSELEQTSLAAGFRYQRDWSQRFGTEFSLYNTDYKLKAVNANVEDSQRFLQRNEVSETGIGLKSLYAPSSRVSINTGYQFIETKVTNLDDVDEPRFRLLEGEVLRTHALFSELSLAPGKGATNLNLGMRLNYLDKFNRMIWEPRLSFNHSFSQYLSVELLGEFKHQATSQIINFQNDFLGLEKRRWQLANDISIPVMTSRQGSLGLSYTKRNWLLNTVAFYKRIEGVTTQSQGFQDAYEFVRTAGSYDASGLDVLLRKQLSKTNMWISYSYLQSNYSFEELEESSFRNNFDVSHALTVGASYSLNNFLLAAGVNWRTGVPFTPPVAGNEIQEGVVNYGPVNSDALNDYLRVDISGRYTFDWGKNKRVQLGMALWNLLNRENTINRFYRPDAQDQLQQLDQRSLGITPNASIRLIFL